MEGGAGEATVHGVAKSRTGLSDFTTSSPPSRRRQARSQNKGQSRASGLRTSPPPARDRQVRAARAEGGNCSPREASNTKLQADFSANQYFLGLWTIDIHREGRRQGSAPQKKHTRRCTPRKPSGWDWGEDKSQPSTGGDSAHQAPRHLNHSDLGWVQNAGPTKSAPL